MPGPILPTRKFQKYKRGSRKAPIYLGIRGVKGFRMPRKGRIVLVRTGNVLPWGYDNVTKPVLSKFNKLKRNTNKQRNKPVFTLADLEKKRVELRLRGYLKQRAKISRPMSPERRPGPDNLKKSK